MNTTTQIPPIKTSNPKRIIIKHQVNATSKNTSEFIAEPSYPNDTNSNKNTLETSPFYNSSTLLNITTKSDNSSNTFESVSSFSISTREKNEEEARQNKELEALLQELQCCYRSIHRVTQNSTSYNNAIDGRWR